MANSRENITGLTSDQALELQKKWGKNELTAKKKESFLYKAFHIVSEPMFLLLLAAAVIYFILGEPRDGAIMLVFVLGIISIELIQQWKTDKTLHALRDLSAPHIRVIRDGVEQTIQSNMLVPGDLMLVNEGDKIPADGVLIACNDLCVDESSLTGEAEGVWKKIAANAEPSEDFWRKDTCYAGTLVTQGSAQILVETIGAATEYGKIGENVSSAPDLPTPLQKQTAKLVKLCACIAGVLFILVGVITYFNLSAQPFKERMIESILSGITLAMAMIPEEFPVILTVFLSMGAWRLAKKHSLVRNLPSVETLGAVSVLCVDKTGTITMNQMTVHQVWAPNNDLHTLTQTMALACETDVYDPMEKAMLAYCETMDCSTEALFSKQQVHEYPFTNLLKMMGHVWKDDEKITIAAKGSSEKLLDLCILTHAQRAQAQELISEMSMLGLRVIAVGKMELEKEAKIPERITDCMFTLSGLVGLYDPPRDSVAKDIQDCVKAGVRVVMITGDSDITASAIAKQVGMPGSDKILTGDVLENMSDEELREKVRDVYVFSRVIPEHKMRIVRAYQENGEIVAMTGDGVNDAPALKYANIGIAMGKRGSEVSREAADLILLDDNFSTIVDTIADGRRIYDNIRKAIGYVFAIHIPIALAALLGPFLHIRSEDLLLLPLHVVLLELLIDPTCSIVLERQPAERTLMQKPPRKPTEQILSSGTLIKSIVQGITIFGASFGAYYWILLQNPQNATLARTMGLTIIMFANIFLVQVNSSDCDLAIHTFSRLAKDKVMWGVNICTILGICIILYTPAADFLKLQALSATQFFTAFGVAGISVIWYELVKIFRKRTKN